MKAASVFLILLLQRYFGTTDWVVIAYQPNFVVCVIPGLTRNPDYFQYVTLLDAGSGPA